MSDTPAAPLAHGFDIGRLPDEELEQLRRTWKGLCDLAHELGYDTYRPALQELYFEGIEFWRGRYMEPATGGEEWDNRRRKKCG